MKNKLLLTSEQKEQVRIDYKNFVFSEIEHLKTMFYFDLVKEPHKRVETNVAQILDSYYDELLEQQKSFNKNRMNERVLIDLTSLLKNSNKANKIVELLEIFKNPESYISPSKQYKLSCIKNTKIITNDNLIGFGTLMNDLNHSLTDTCLTPGAYEKYIAIEKSKIHFHIVRFSIIGNIEFSLIEEHYNNNICGVPTGNGTRKYEIGEIKKVLSLQYDILELIKSDDYNINIDFDKAFNLLKTNILNCILYGN